MDDNKKILGLQNPGNYCYILSAIQGLRSILQEFFKYHSLQILYYEEFTKNINIYIDTLKFQEKLKQLKNNGIFENIYKNIIKNITDKYGKIKNNIKLEFIYDKFEKHHLKICCLLILKKIIDNIIQNEDKGIIVTVPFLKLFTQCVKENGLDYICNGEQNDSNEFIIILLDYMNDCVSEGKNCILEDNSILKLTANDLNELDINNRIKIQIQQHYYKLYSKDYSYFSDNINSLMLNIIKCVNCNFKQTSINSSNVISCSVDDNDNSLKSCLDNYFKEEFIEYKCDKCKEKNNNIMLKKILDLKKYLIITFKKFDFNTELQIMTKKHNTIEYPLILDINNYTLSNLNNQFALKSVINHVGMLNYGHYFTDTKFNDKWLRCNDENINLLPVDKVINNPSAYILIYEKL